MPFFPDKNCNWKGNMSKIGKYLTKNCICSLKPIISRSWKCRNEKRGWNTTWIGEHLRRMLIKMPRWYVLAHLEKSRAQHLSRIIIKMQPGDTTKRDEGALSGQKTTDYDTWRWHRLWHNTRAHNVRSHGGSEIGNILSTEFRNSVSANVYTWSAQRGCFWEEDKAIDLCV